MKGKLVRTLSHLDQLRRDRRAVYVSHHYAGHRGYIPAAWVMNFPGTILHYMLKNKSIREYKKK